MTKSTDAVLLDTSAVMDLLLEEPDWQDIHALIMTRAAIAALQGVKIL